MLLYYGGGKVTKVNDQNKPLTSEFVTLELKGRTDGFMLKGGDATKAESPDGFVLLHGSAMKVSTQHPSAAV